MDDAGIRRLLREQDGVVSRAQVLGLGGSAVDVRRKLRRREWAVVHRGVYVHHTGPLTTRQRHWAAVLACGPGAALHLESALEAHGVLLDRSPRHRVVHVAVDEQRTPVPPRGVRIHRVVGLGDWVAPARRPPRVALELAALSLASRRDETGAIAVLADVCREGATTPGRLAAAAHRLPRLRGRRWMLEVLDDVASGTHSVLEHRYLTWVERPHGLPAGQRQRQESTADGVVVRDARYDEASTVVELDGRFGHTDSDDRWDDLDRDVLAAVGGLMTLRLGWRQVLRPCRSAERVATVLSARGWTGVPTPCGRPECDVVGFESPGDPNPTTSAVRGAGVR